jgi:hypothetical protein
MLSLNHGKASDDQASFEPHQIVDSDPVDGHTNENLCKSKRGKWEKLETKFTSHIRRALCLNVRISWLYSSSI